MLSGAEERSLVYGLIVCTEFDSPFSLFDLRIDLKNVSKFKDNFPGKNWILNFFKRVKRHLTQRLCQNIKIVRVLSIKRIPAENILNYN